LAVHSTYNRDHVVQKSANAACLDTASVVSNGDVYVVVVSGDSGHETTVYFPKVDCILKLGQFFSQLQFGLRINA